MATGIVMYSLAVAGFVMPGAKLVQRFGSTTVFRHVVLAAAAIIMIVFGFNNLNRRGLGAAQPGAPFDILGMSPASLLIVAGVAVLQGFIAWTRRVQDSGRTPLLDLRVITSSQERAAVVAMFAVVALEAMLNFSVPLCIQIVQGRTPIETAIAMMPFNLTVFFTAMLVVRLYRVFAPRVIGMAGFALCTVALLWLAWVVRNDWSAPVVMSGLILFGLGQGALVTLVFNVLVTAAPKELAGDVGSLRGTAQNLAAGVATAVAGALLVGLLGANVLRGIAENPALPAEVQSQVNLDSINFVSNDRLRSVMERTSATPQQVEEAVRVNTEARLRALKIGMLRHACRAELPHPRRALRAEVAHGAALRRRLAAGRADRRGDRGAAAAPCPRPAPALLARGRWPAAPGGADPLGDGR